MDNINLSNSQQELLLRTIFPVAIASCASVLMKHDEYKIRHVARASLAHTKTESKLSIDCLKDRFLGTRIGKFLLNPFGYQFEIKSDQESI